jgi:4,5-DOPA dioxygenase extradiol
MTKMTMPTLFLSHGSPMLAIEPSPAHDFLRGLGARLPRPTAVLVISAHYMQRSLAVTSSDAPDTIHDFGGFPQALYELRYAAPGAPELAQRVARLLDDAGLPTRLDERRGLDHGAWVPLSLVYPEHDIPVLQLSLAAHGAPSFHAEVGRALRPLRDDGVLIVASGTATHNLHEYFRPGRGDGGVPQWVAEFAQWLTARIEEDDRAALLDYRAQAPHAERNHPTPEHIMPLFVALGAAADGERAMRLHASYDHVLAMDAFAWGWPWSIPS